MTNWLRYFKKNGPRTFNWVERFPRKGYLNDQHYTLHYATYHGATPDGQLYVSRLSITDAEISRSQGGSAIRGMVQDREQAAKDYLATFLDPNCRCRFGYHFRCSVHKKWRD